MSDKIDQKQFRFRKYALYGLLILFVIAILFTIYIPNFRQEGIKDKADIDSGKKVDTANPIRENFNYVDYN